MQFEVVINGLNPLIERAEAAGDSIQPYVNKALFKSATAIQKLARLNAPIRTGNLKGTILTEAGDGFSRVLTNEKYGAYVEYGTAPHIILPKTKKALFWKGAAYPVKVVNHPGTKANPFFERSVEESLPTIQGIFTAMTDAFAAEVAGL